MSNVDLSALKIDEAQAAVPKRPIGPRLLVIGLCAIALTVAATFLVPIIWPPRAVTTAPVRAADFSGKATAAAVTEAVGWVEADPFPVIVRPLVSGHIETLEVLEGETVRANETVIATLASAELVAACERAEATVAEREAHLKRANANHQLAADRLRQNAEALLRLQAASIQLAAVDTKLTTARTNTQTLAANVASAEAVLAAQQRLQELGQAYPVAIQRAKSDADAAKAKAKANQTTIDGLLREREEQHKNVAICEQLAAEPVNLRGAVAIAKSELDTASAALDKARVDLKIANRELGWATLRPPIDGVVLRLEANPGDMVGHGQKGVVALYDPKKLRARIDVPIDSLQGVVAGQEVEITSEAIGNQVVKGVVQRLQHETDMLKNTLQVKIGLIDPPPLLRPETLCRARFLAQDDEDGPEVIAAFRVPSAAVQDGRVYIYDPATDTARAIPVEVIGEDGDDRIIRGNLSPTHRVVTEPVTHGESITEQTR